jgi:excisionase family DNA binding protein
MYTKQKKIMTQIPNIQQQLDYLTKLVEQNGLSQKTVLTIEDAARYTGRSRSNLYKLTSRGIIPHYKPHGSRIYFKREELDAWMLQNPVRTAAAIEQEAATYVTLKPTNHWNSKVA